MLSANFAHIIDSEHIFAIIPRLATAVRLGGVEQRYTVLDGIIHDVERGTLLDFAAEGSCPEPKSRHANATSSERATFDFNDSPLLFHGVMHQGLNVGRQLAIDRYRKRWYFGILTGVCLRNIGPVDRSRTKGVKIEPPRRIPHDCSDARPVGSIRRYCVPQACIEGHYRAGFSRELPFPGIWL